MKNRIFFFIPALILFCAGLLSQRARAQPVRYNPYTENKIAQVAHNLYSWVQIKDKPNWTLAERMAVHRVNGVSIAVIHNYKIEWVRAYGWADTAERRKATPATLFQAASVGKSVNAAAWLRLVEQKKAGLHTDINHILHSWKFPYDTATHGRQITLANILSHSAGLSVHGFDGYKTDAALPNLKQILDGKPPANSEAVRSLFPPDTKFEYSGGGFEISELMMEDVTGLSYPEWIKRFVFRPLQMNSSTYQIFRTPQPGISLSSGYRSDQQAIGCKYHLYPEKACGAGLWTTATDLAKFVIELQLSLKGNSNKILSKKMTTLMLSPYKNGYNSGYGVFLDNKGGQKYFQHSGLNEGFTSQYYGSFENGNGVVVMANSDDTDFIPELVNSVAQVYGWKDFAPYQLKKVIKLSPSVLSSYTGRYQFSERADDNAVISIKDGELYLKDSHSDQAWRIYFTAEQDCFMYEARWVDQQFFKNDDGTIGGFYIITSNSRQVAKKVN